MLGDKKTQLLVVCDDKTEKYANYLAALVSQKDDTEENIIGTKDDSVIAAVMNTKRYRDSISSISSSNNVLFIGSFKEAKDIGKNINFIFNKYGMHYGWLGTRGVMYVENKALSNDEYESFLEFGEEYQKKFEKVNGNFILDHPWIAAISGAFVSLGIPVAGYMLERNKHRKEVRDQQYTCLTLVFYLDALRQYLEG